MSARVRIIPIVVALFAAITVALILTATPSEAATTASRDAAHSGECASTAKWQRVKRNMAPERVQHILGVRAIRDGGTDWWGNYGMKSYKYDICGKWGHGYVDYYNDSDGRGWWLQSKVLYQYI